MTSSQMCFEKVPLPRKHGTFNNAYDKLVYGMDVVIIKTNICVRADMDMNRIVLKKQAIEYRVYGKQFAHDGLC